MELPANCPKWLVEKSLQEYIKIIFFTVFFQFLGLKFDLKCSNPLFIILYPWLSMAFLPQCCSIAQDHIWITGPNLCKNTIHGLWIHLPRCYNDGVLFIFTKRFNWHLLVQVFGYFTRVHPIPDIPIGENPHLKSGRLRHETTSQLTSFSQVRNR